MRREAPDRTARIETMYTFHQVATRPFFFHICMHIQLDLPYNLALHGLEVSANACMHDGWKNQLAGDEVWGPLAGDTLEACRSRPVAW